MNASELLAEGLVRRDYTPNKVLTALLSFGIQESALAHLLGVSTQMISIWKLGKRPIAKERIHDLYRILETFIDSKQATIGLLKQQGKWDAQLRKIVNDRFRKAEKIFNARPAQYRGEDEAA